ncbi:MAG: hypothetical protein HY774_03305 [Acidobacteria bacterium]|nr:hypothetical protein [Acidobacteriota bacterium]
MTNSIHPRNLIHRGVVEAAGILIPINLCGITEAQRRVIGHWEAGARVFRVAGGYLVQFSASHLIDCRLADGLPVVALGKTLSTVPLTSQELKALQPQPNSLVTAQGGQIHIESLAEQKLETLSAWIDLSNFQVVEVTSLGSPPPAIVETAPALVFDPRQQLDGVPLASPQMAEVIAALTRPVRVQSAPPSTSQRSSENRQPGFFARLISQLKLMTAFLRSQEETQTSTTTPSPPARKPSVEPVQSPPRPWWRQLVDTIGQLFGSRQPEPPDDQLRVLPPSPQSMFENMSNWARRLTARFLLFSRLAHLIGQQQARYLSKMMDMFERGDLHEALRHAIPLSSLPGEGKSVPALSVPFPRSRLSISPYQQRAGSSIGMGEELFAQLRQLYRAAFDRLNAQGKIEEAAFVLAELLQENEEAVAFLERHGRLKLAAEMAEARQLAAGLVVRQWFLAGNRRRAVTLARRTGAFADAIVRLEKTDPQQANTLRLLWATTQAEAGEYPAAVNTIWPVSEARHIAADWVERAIAGGGVVAGQMLAYKLTLFPTDHEAMSGPVLDLLADEDPEKAPMRAAFRRTLVADAPKGPVPQMLARAAVRATIRDMSQGHVQATTNELTNLLTFAGDAALRTDVPTVTSPHLPKLQTITKPRIFTADATDAGLMPVYDAAYLPDGKCLVALGESGIRLLSSQGKTLTHFDKPATALVLSDQGNRAIGLIRRGEVWKLTKLDLTTRSASDWCEAELSDFARDFDGQAWVVNSRDDILVIDTLGKRFEALWRIPEIGRTLTISRSTSQCSLFVVNGQHKQVEIWTYALPQFRLQSREAITFTPDSVLERTVALNPGGFSLNAALQTDTHLVQVTRCWQKSFLSKQELTTATALSPNQPVLTTSWMVIPVRNESEVRVYVLDWTHTQTRLELLLNATREVSLRLTNDDTLTICDHRGRIFVFELTYGNQLRNLRMGTT